MKIQPRFFAFALCMAVATASAQSYRWVDKDGKVVYGDIPPTGTKVTTLRPPPPSAVPPSAPAAAGKDATKDAKKGPLTPTEQEQAFRKRKLEEDDARKKQEEALAAVQGRKENCDRSQENVRQIESGQRISRTDAKGERYYLDDDQRAVELANARKAVAEWCSSK